MKLLWPDDLNNKHRLLHRGIVNLFQLILYLSTLLSHMNTPNDDKLDAYLQDASKQLKSKKSKHTPKKVKKPSRITLFTQWKGAASMDLYRISTVVFAFLFGSLITLMIDVQWSFYLACLGSFIFFCGLIFCIIDYNHFKNWDANLNFKFEGWKQFRNNRSRNYWKFNAENWIPVNITVVMNPNADRKHQRVAEAFLKKLRKRLNQWTVSSKTYPGYSQPDGWQMLDLTLTGDMNARVMNLVRKRFSGELNKLTRLMPGSLQSIEIKATGKEKYHEVYTETD
jgi:hypothetical protein